ncbi:hypothetical protein [Elizabethkingia anophelis]|uniref:Uncharacterized protein n=1 Tax=Elizabethkingia anophelis TaxID=1117645 RepID=A0A455ZID9_9FLAO|nr:hypothetical protein [Elizabethkingia anophelis]DAC76435.1 TPA_exp: hypothetical protein [Elizabethkingia anophelis]
MMKALATLIILVFAGIIPVKSQQVVINEKLLAQLTKNQAVRLSSDKLFFNSYEKQKQLYDDIKGKITQVVAIQEYIYNKLTNVNMAIKQGKQLQYLYQYFGEIAQNSGEMLSLTSKNPEYAALLTKYYVFIGNEVLNIKKEVTEEILRESNDFLMDPYDREILLRKIFDRVRIINGTILYINLVLKNAKQTPYIYQIPVLSNYVNLDKMIVKDIIMKYGILKY